ncbi:hypothetical protein [uncultured Bilophila sp.]|uniref:hypothetical protein n=1 Tax=uncultured Bilophila sp. TaxID=529385 RepID=UPI0026DB4D37|nr:hypothetical protein [uncultured Bilophila sp.]
MSIDEREDPDEEQEAVFASMPFVLNNDVVDTYGTDYTITLNEEAFPVVTPLNANASPAAGETCTLQS